MIINYQKRLTTIKNNCIYSIDIKVIKPFHVFAVFLNVFVVRLLAMLTHHLKPCFPLPVMKKLVTYKKH